MEAPGSPFHTTADSDLNSTTNSDAPNQSMNNTDGYESIITGDILYISIIASIEIPTIFLAIYAVNSLIKSKRDASVFVINLLISDLIQIVCMLLFIVWFNFYWLLTLSVIIFWAGVTGLYFMTCIAVERYVLIAHPVWHRSHRSVKCLVCTSLTGWLMPLIVIPVCTFIKSLTYIMPFLPYAVIILCSVGTYRSLSHSISFTPLKKQLVLAPLFFVVISYTFLILPLQICLFVNLKLGKYPVSLDAFTVILYLLNPLVDCLLYVFMRSDAENIIRTSHCCTRLKRVQSETGHTTSTDVQHDHV